MPYKDPKKHRDYYRNYMRQRRAARREADPEGRVKSSPAAKDQEIARLKARVRELEAQARKSASNSERHGQVAHGRRQEFTEVGRLKAEIGRLKSDIAKLKMALQEEPDAAKLRKKVVEQQVEMANLRHELRRLIKERDRLQARVKPKFRSATGLLTRKNHDIIIKALHFDRRKQLTADELATAERVAIALRPLFDEGA